MSDTLLSIVIPSYLRSESSVLNDEQFLDEAAALGVQVFISDDSPDDSIQQLYESRRARYANVHYRRNVPALKHDRNVISSLLWPESRFTWILGDSFRTVPGVLSRVLDELDDQDFYFINWNSSDHRMIGCLDDADAAEFIVERVWHQTLTGGTIYHDRVRRWVADGPREFHANFPHVDVILGYASTHDISVGWRGEPTLYSVPKGASYWTRRALDVFVGDWSSVLTAYPRAIPPERLPEVIRSHSQNTRLFNLPFLATLRATGHLDRAALRAPHFWHAMHAPRVLVLALVLVPPGVLRSLLSASRAVRARRDDMASRRSGRPPGPRRAG